MTVFRDFQGPRPRRGIGVARPRHSKTCLETSSSVNSTSSLPRLFADDTCLNINADSLSNLELIINSELKKISEWVNANQLTINPAKSNALLVPPKLNRESNNITVAINSTPIEVVKEAKYLELIIDNKLTFGSLIDYLESKLSRAVGIISKLKHIFPSSVLIKLYYASLHSNLLYGLLIWHNTYSTYTNKISRLQNKTIKLIANSRRTDKRAPIYEKPIKFCNFTSMKQRHSRINSITINYPFLFRNILTELQQFIQFMQEATPLDFRRLTTKDKKKNSTPYKDFQRKISGYQVCCHFNNEQETF